MLELTHPWFLALALVVVFLAWTQRRSLADLTPTQRRVCFALRTLLLLILVLALAGIRWLLPSRELAVIFAVDQSASISAAAKQEARDFVATSLATQHAGDVTGVIGFAGSVELWQPPLTAAKLATDWPALAERNSTDLGSALDFASALFPAGRSKRLVLLTDGNDTAGHAAQVATHLDRQSVELFTVPLHNAAAPEVLVEKVDVPRRLKHGEPFDLTAHIRSNVATTAKVKLYQTSSSSSSATFRSSPVTTNSAHRTSKPTATSFPTKSKSSRGSTPRPKTTVPPPPPACAASRACCSWMVMKPRFARSPTRSAAKRSASKPAGSPACRSRSKISSSSTFSSSATSPR